MAGPRHRPPDCRCNTQRRVSFLFFPSPTCFLEIFTLPGACFDLCEYVPNWQPQLLACLLLVEQRCYACWHRSRFKLACQGVTWLTLPPPQFSLCVDALVWYLCAYCFGRVPSLLGRVPSLLGREPSLLGRVPPLLGRVPSLLGRVPSLLGRVPSLLGRVPSLLGRVPFLLGRVLR